MAVTRTAAVAAVLVVVLVLAPGATAAFVGGSIADADDGADVTDGSDDSMGTAVTTFMQSTATDAGVSVDEGMFDAAYENADDATRAALVEERTDALVARLEALESERSALDEHGPDANPAAYNAKLAQLAVRIDALERGIDETEPRAEAVGVDTATLEDLRANASAFTGPEVAAVASAIHGVDPARGPPAGAPNESAGGPADSPGASGGDVDRSDEQRGAGPASGSDRADERTEAASEPGSTPGRDAETSRATVVADVPV